MILILTLVIFLFLDGDVPSSTSSGVCISQLIRFAKVSGHVTDFSVRNKVLTGKLCHQSYRYHKLRKMFFQNFIAGTMN